MSRRKHFLLLLLKCGMPLVGDTQSRFVWKKSEDALKIARLVQQDIMYKPKPVAALMASAQSEKENKNPRPRQPKARGKKNAKPEDQNQTVQTDTTDTSTVVSDPPAVSLPLLSVISAVVDEGLWQLTSRANPVDVDVDPDCSPKMLDMLGLGIQLLISNGDGVKVAEDTVLKTLPQYREFVSRKLGDFSNGYLACKNWPALAEPVLELQSHTEATAPGGAPQPHQDDSALMKELHGDAGTQVVAPASFRTLPSDKAMAMLAFCRQMPLGPFAVASVAAHPCYQSCETDLLSWRLEMRAASGNSDSLLLTPLIDQLCKSVCTRLDPAWVSEASLIYKDNFKDYDTFFASEAHVRQFLLLRTHVMLALLKLVSPWLAGADQIGNFRIGLFDDTCVQMVAAADSNITNRADLTAFWMALYKFVLDKERSSSSSSPSSSTPFCDDLGEWVLDVQELLGLLDLDLEDQEATEATEATDAAAMTGESTETPAAASVLLVSVLVSVPVPLVVSVYQL